MKIFTNTEYYRCEYCNKLYLRKSACEKHEGLCGSNPKNKDACIDCNYCTKKDKIIEFDHHLYSYKPIKTHYFFCDKLKKDMYPFAAVRKDLPNRFPEDFDEQIQMPHKCDNWEHEGFQL